MYVGVGERERGRERPCPLPLPDTNVTANTPHSTQAVTQGNIGAQAVGGWSRESGQGSFGLSLS